MAGVEVGTAYVTVVPSAKGFASKLQGELGGTMSAAGAKAGNSAASGFGTRFKVGMKAAAVAGAAALAGAFAVGGNFAKDAIDAASDLGETVNKSNTIFGKNAAAIDKWSKTAATSMGLSRQQALDAASGFGDMFSQLGFSGKAAANMSQKVVQMSADLGSFNNLPTEDVTQRLSAAFRGEFDSLQALIPNINAARVEHEALAKTGKKSAKELTAQEKAAATLAIVQKDGARAAGDFAKTSGGLANQQKILGARFDDVKAAVGERLLPVATKLVTWAADFVKGMQDGTGAGGRFADKAREIGERISGFVSDFKNGEGAAGKFREILEKIVSVATDVARWIGRNADVVQVLAAALGAGLVAFKLITTAVKVYTGIQAALNVVLAANPIGLVIIVIAALVAGIIVAYKKSETFRNVVKGAFEAISKAARFMWNNVVAPVIRFLLAAFSNVTRFYATMLRGLSKVPGFGWAKKAADALDGAANKADKLRQNIKDIPSQKTINIDIYQRTRQVGRVEVGGKQVNVGMRAHGGTVQAGQPYIVGERRPELFVPSENGRIEPRVQGGGGLSQADINRLAAAMSQVQVHSTISAGSFDSAMAVGL